MRNRTKKVSAFSESVGEGLRRAAISARETALMHGTPVVGMINGKLVAENPFTGATAPIDPPLTKKKRAKIEAAGFKIGTADDFLDLTVDTKPFPQFSVPTAKSVELRNNIFNRLCVQTFREMKRKGGTRIDAVCAFVRDARKFYGAGAAQELQRNLESELPNLTAYEIVRLRSVGVEEDLLAEEGGALTAGRFATALGVSIAIIRKHQKKKVIFAVPRGRAVRYPGWQIFKKKILPGLHETLLALGDLDPMGVTAYFLTPAEALDDKRPLDLLRANNSNEVATHARNHVDYR